MDIAPLGFAIETGGLERGKKSAREFAEEVARSTEATARHAIAMERAAERAHKMAQAEMALLTSKQKVTAADYAAAKAKVDETKATLDAAKATSTLARGKAELARETANATAEGKGFTAQMGTMPAVMQGVVREASAMATTMGIGGAAGRLGMAGAMGAAQGAAARLAPQLSSLTGLTGKLAIGVGTAVAAYAALAASVADNQDRFASYQQQLANSLGDQGAADTFYKVVDLANEVGIGIDAALQSFNRFARVKDEIGATNEELLLMTETIMKLGRASGVESGAMQGAMMQFSQALAAGRLNGDELRSIMENMQPLAKAIAEGMGVSVGQLKRMGAEGELTSQKIFRGLLSQQEKANEEFEKMPRTVEMAKQRMANQFDELGAHIGEIIEASGAIQAVMNAVGSIAEAGNAALRALRERGMTEDEKRLDRLLEKQKQLEAATRGYHEQLVKDFLKDEARSAELEKQKKSTQDHIQLKRDLLKATQAALAEEARGLKENEGKVRRLMALSRGARAAGNTKLAGTIAGQIEDEISGFDQQRTKLRDYTKEIAQAERALAEIERQHDALGRNGAWEKLVDDVEKMNDALGEGLFGAGLSRRLEALQIVEKEGGRVADVEAKMRDQARLRVEDDVRIKQAEAELNEEMARRIAAGENVMQVEAEMEAAQRALADGIDRGTAAFKSYTDAILASKRALQELADANEIRRLMDQVEEFAAVIGAITGGGGSYEERLAKTNVGIRQFQRDRATGSVSASPVTTGGAGGGPVSLQSVIGLLQAGIGIHQPTNRQLTGGKHVDGSYHYRGQAIDFVPKGGMGSVTKAQIRALLEASGISILELLGPGDKGHNNHFHVAFALASAALSGGVRAPGSATGLTEDVALARRALFEEQERERGYRATTGAMGGASVALLKLQQAEGDTTPLQQRQLDLQLRINDAIKEVAPEFREDLELAMRLADSYEQQEAAVRRINEMRRDNDNQARRNDAARTGDPAVMRQLELELEIEEIRRTTPIQQQDRMIGQAIRRSDLERDAGLSRAFGSLERQKDAMAEQVKLLSLFGDEARIQNALLQARNQLFEMGITPSHELYDTFLRQTEELERQAIVLDRLRQLHDNAKQTAEEIGQAFRDFLGAAAREGELNWKTAIRGIEEAFYGMLDRVIQQFVISPLVNLLMQAMNMGLNALFGGGMAAGGGGINVTSTNYSGSYGGWGGALGGVLSPRGVEPFAHGDIFNAPTRFLFGGGRSGLGGEGPGIYEALMPLKRGPDGRLGVAAQGAGGGGGTQVTIIDQRGANAEAVEVEERQGGDGMRQIRVMIRDAVKSNARSGTLDADLRGAYGINRRATRR